MRRRSERWGSEVREVRLVARASESRSGAGAKSARGYPLREWNSARARACARVCVLVSLGASLQDEWPPPVTYAGRALSRWSTLALRALQPPSTPRRAPAAVLIAIAAISGIAGGDT